MAEKLSDEVINCVRNAWKTLAESTQKDEETGELHWVDVEREGGFLKDVDALNAFMEPYLLAPASFVDPPLDAPAVQSHMERLLQGIQEPRKGDSGVSYRGFTSEPYPYFNMEVDLVDSAASVLRLIANYLRLVDVRAEVLPKEVPREFTRLMESATVNAVEFLLEAKVEDRKECRWQGIQRETDPPGKFANLFFTNVAALALHNVQTCEQMKRWIGSDRSEKVATALRKVPEWVAGLYDPGRMSFGLDPSKGTILPICVVYAVELIYKLSPKEINASHREICKNAVIAQAQLMKDTKAAAGLQVDFFHRIPAQTGRGDSAYDDRRYIGSFLSIFSLMKSAEPDIVEDEFVAACEALYQGVTDEWIDENTNMWDDGRPLICFSLDAMVGLVEYGLGGRVEELRVRGDVLRKAVVDALGDKEVVKLVTEKVMENIARRPEREMIRQLSRSSAKRP
jgi:hypothetical protein